MTYVSTSRRPNPAALIGALGIPGAIGALMVVGLAVTVVTTPKRPPIIGEDVPTVPLPPPPPDPTPVDTPPTGTTANKTIKVPTIPTPTDTWPTTLDDDNPVNTLPGTGETTGPVTGPSDFPLPGPGPSASPFDPVGAVPRGNPGRWVTNEDYRPRWIRENLTGAARFTLAIDAGGKVTDCTITRSTGHGVLDDATCLLLRKRARFDAARDGSGKPVAGSYSGTITWRIPE
jgi:protein TonB